MTDNEKAHAPTDERAIFEAIADRLGEHSQATNFEIADSGEYETKLRGPVDVEVLAEWLIPTVLSFRRSEVPEPSARRDPDPLWDRCYDDGSRMMSPAKAKEPQGEPSDAQVLAHVRTLIERHILSNRRDLDSYWEGWDDAIARAVSYIDEEIKALQATKGVKE